MDLRGWRVRPRIVLTLCALGSLAVNGACFAQSATLLHPLFQDHAVLQRDAPIRVWGRAAPNERLAVALDQASVEVRAAADGAWNATLPAHAAGGPYSLTVTGASASQTIRDVLVGDVWLCSGQSNMQLQVHRSLDARAEIASANNDSIRLLTIPMDSSPTPLTEFKSPVRWQAASSTTVPEFSATCFYFARELQKTVNVPMGLINSSWGGSKIEGWMSRQGLGASEAYAKGLELLETYVKDPGLAARRWGDTWQAWWRAQRSVPRGDEPWRAPPRPGDGWRAAPASLGAWEAWGVPELASFDGMLWYRTQVKLTASQAAQEATLLLGGADEVDQTWVNGRSVGSSYGPDTQRRYALPKGTLKSGDNLIVVNVLDTYKDGGLAGPASAHALQLADGATIPLGNAWQYRLPPPNLQSVPRTPWESVGGLPMIYNAMIAPLGAYGLRGVAWYQGESNTEQAATYGELLTHLMADWRHQFGARLPFLIVQLASHGAPPTQPGESDWAELREAQRLAVANDAQAALAVAIDIGERYDIHPANKQDVGRRLARAARHLVFGEKISPSGPVPLAAERTADGVVVTFGDVEQHLLAYGAPGPVGFELCGAEVGSCRYASAELQGSRVLLRAPAVSAPTRVRYCWADSPICTLYDAVPLPAGPFEIPVRAADTRHE